MKLTEVVPNLWHIEYNNIHYAVGVNEWYKPIYKEWQYLNMPKEAAEIANKSISVPNEVRKVLINFLNPSEFTLYCKYYTPINRFIPNFLGIKIWDKGYVPLPGSKSSEYGDTSSIPTPPLEVCELLYDLPVDFYKDDYTLYVLDNYVTLEPAASPKPFSLLKPVYYR